MPNTNTSLLVTEEEGNAVPSLGGTHLESDEDYQSPLERLITKSTLEQRGETLANVPAAWGGEGNDLATASRTTATAAHGTASMMASAPASPRIPERIKSSRVTLAACTCCLLQMGFVWASFLSPSWLDTRLFLSISLPSVQIKTENSQLLHATTLGSLLSDLLDADQHWAAMALVLSSLILPCLCIISGVIWIVEDRKEQKKLTSDNSFMSRRQKNGRWGYWCPRILLEYSARIGFAVVFILCIFDVGTSPLSIEFEDSRFIVVNQIKGGMTSYTVGMIFGIAVLVLLRFDKKNSQRKFGTTFLGNNNTIGQGGQTSRKRDSEFSWEIHSNELFYRYENRTEVGNDEQKLGTPLLGDRSPSNDGTDQILGADKTSETSDDRPTETTEQQGLSLWKRIVLYEVALVSTVLWIPATFLPLFHLEYEGVLSDFMPQNSLSFCLKDFPFEIWERGISAGTGRFLLFVQEILFVILVFACPLVANLAAIGAWMFGIGGIANKTCTSILSMLQPFVGAIIFGVAIYVSVPAFETVIESAVEKVDPGVCSGIDTNACFDIEGQPSTGMWFLLAEALALELFIALTLAWQN